MINGKVFRHLQVFYVQGNQVIDSYFQKFNMLKQMTFFVVLEILFKFTLE